jgi:hypothetical protein
MRRKRKSLVPATPLTPVPVEILDQFVRHGLLSIEALEAAVRRFKNAIIEPRVIPKHARRFAGFDDRSWRCMPAG